MGTTRIPEQNYMGIGVQVRRSLHYVEYEYFECMVPNLSNPCYLFSGQFELTWFYFNLNKKEIRNVGLEVNMRSFRVTCYTEFSFQNHLYVGLLILNVFFFSWTSLTFDPS